jgi:hypothetical protein
MTLYMQLFHIVFVRITNPATLDIPKVLAYNAETEQLEEARQNKKQNAVKARYSRQHSSILTLRRGKEYGSITREILYCHFHVSLLYKMNVFQTKKKNMTINFSGLLHLTIDKLIRKTLLHFPVFSLTNILSRMLDWDNGQEAYGSHSNCR